MPALLGSSLIAGLTMIASSSIHRPALAQSGAPPAATASVSRPTVRLGDQGPAVTELQGMLRLLGFYSGPVNGNFSDRTQAAVVAFQRAAGLTADGVVGASTWNRLLPAAPGTRAGTTAPTPSPRPAPSPTPQRPRPPAATTPTRPAAPADQPTLRLGMEGPSVALLQERLRAKGSYQGSLDGIFGEQTEAAVKSFQTRNGLEADGVVGPATWRALLR